MNNITNTPATTTENTKIENTKVTSDDVVEITGDLLQSVAGGMSRTNRDSPPGGAWASDGGGGGDF
jgi:hypothetical protein